MGAHDAKCFCKAEDTQKKKTPNNLKATFNNYEQKTRKSTL